jgi:repressor LexA
MVETLITRLQSLMEEKGYNPTSLSKLAGIGPTGVRDILNGIVVSPKVQTIAKIANVLGVSSKWLISGDEDDRIRIPLVGIVSAGEGWIPCDPDHRQVDFEPGATDMIAVEIRGDSMLPTYRDGDVLICNRQRGRSVADQVGKDCVVETADGQNLVKVLKKGSRKGLYTLKSYNPRYDDIENVGVAWAAPVLWVKRQG